MMDYLNRSTRITLLTMLSGLGGLTALATTACDKGSLGEYGTDSDSDSESGSGDGTDSSASTSGSASNSGTSVGTSGTSASTTSTGEVTGTTDTGNPTVSDTATSVTTGGSTCEPSENFLCSAPFECSGDGACGGLDSAFDESGCLRPSCNVHSDCGDGELCYHAIYHGGCQSSGYFCQDGEGGECECGADPDCGGAFCVPLEIYLGGAELGPQEGRSDNDCAPDDGAAFTVELGLDANACEAEPTDGVVTITVYSAWGDFGVYDLSLASAGYTEGGEFTPAVSGLLTVSSSGDNAYGEYEITLTDGRTIVNSFDVPFCNSSTACG